MFRNDGSVQCLDCGDGFTGVFINQRASQVAQLVIRLQCRRSQFDFWVGKIPWKRDRLPIPVFMGFPGG